MDGMGFRSSMARTVGTVAVAAAMLWTAAGVSADEVELLSGIIVRGTVEDETAASVRVRMMMGDTEREMTIERAKIHAITRGGVRRVINEKATPSATAPLIAPPDLPPVTPEDLPVPLPQTPPATPFTPPDTPPVTPGIKPPGGVVRSEAEVDALINQAGRTPPDWWDSVPLNYPKTLDLTFKPSKEGWVPDKYIGQYFVSVVRPNPSRWKPAVKLLHHALTVNRSDPPALRQTMEELARMYGDYLEDFARAAFWWRQAAQTGGSLNAEQAVKLADCYWRLGSKSLAVREASGMNRDITNMGALIKLWSDMGELDRAISLAEDRARRGEPDVGYLAAGNACRYHGEYRRAMDYYQRVLDTNRGSRYLKLSKTYAQQNLDGVRAFEALDLSRIPDGTYSGDGQGYRGPLTTHVTVRGGRITDVRVTQGGRQEDWPASALISIPREIIEKQGVKGVDAVSGATATSQGIINGAAKALAAGTRRST